MLVPNGAVRSRRDSVTILSPLVVSVLAASSHAPLPRRKRRAHRAPATLTARFSCEIAARRRKVHATAGNWPAKEQREQITRSKRPPVHGGEVEKIQRDSAHTPDRGNAADSKTSAALGLGRDESSTLEETRERGRSR